MAFLDAARSRGGFAVTATHAQFVLYAGDTWTLDAALHDDAGAALISLAPSVEWRLRNAAQAVVASLSDRQRDDDY